MPTLSVCICQKTNHMGGCFVCPHCLCVFVRRSGNMNTGLKFGMLEGKASWPWLLYILGGTKASQQKMP